MATTPTLMYRGTLTGTSSTQLYAGASSGVAIVTNIALTNISASAATATINLQTGSTAFTILNQVTIPANTTAFFDLKQVLSGTSNSITGGANNSSSVNAHISGVVIV